MPTPEELAADAEAFVPADPPATLGLNVLVERLVELKAQLDATEAHRKEVQKDYDDLRKRLLPSVLGDHGWTSVRTPLGTLSIRSRSRASVPAGRQSAAVGWCQDMGFDEFITLEPSNATAIVNELVAKGAPIPEFLRVFTEEIVVLTRKKE